MRGPIIDKVKKTFIANLYISYKSLWAKPIAQNNEETIIKRLLFRYDVPKVFIEFGFSGWEFNCASLTKTWQGLLLDGDEYNTKIANIIFKKNITSKKIWLNLETLSTIKEWASGKEIGILSVDVDGNDYWFIQNLIDISPSILIAEYNSSFGLRPITVPYDPDFNREEKHPTWTYYGASLKAITKLMKKNGYSLIEIDTSGVNCFFVRDDLITSNDLILEPETSFREKLFMDGSRSEQQWELIKDMEYIWV
ncbi:hypothetical protein [Prochlorococcus sp. MIT 1341]|uniref:hypothetical protein n=1 Tax=Prochlorococcus sp. MIT 1341 TaxID=3096221 RepID=UPI002A764F08|nr:hypothetical protein [Prochlorococcus sp. MIT 1341]